MALDYAAAAACALLLWGMLAHRYHSVPLTLAGTGIVCAPLALRRHHPIAAFVLALVASWLISRDPTLGMMTMGVLAAVLYTVAAACRTRTTIAALVASMSAPLATALPDFAHAGGVVPFALFLITAWTVGYAMGQHRRHVDAMMRNQARLAEAERAEERIRIARELHDVVAHSMSVIAVQAGFGHLVIDDRPGEARAALGAIETAGRETLVEMRRLLGVLREENPSASPLTPAPSLDDLDCLVTQAAQAGVDVKVMVRGVRRDLPSGIDLSAYRIIQEALTNIVKHADVTTARVTLDYRPHELTIEITDHGRDHDGRAGHGGSTGHGLMGMRERVAMCGGRFHARPLPEGGFQVRAALPLPAGTA